MLKKQLLCFVTLFTVLAIAALPGVAQDKEKKEDDKSKDNKKDYSKYEQVYTPKDVKLLRLTTYVCEDGHYTGEFGVGTEREGKCLERLETPGGQSIRECGRKLRLANRRMRSSWRGGRLVVKGQVSDKLPSGLRVMLELRYFDKSSKTVSWKEVRVTGSPRRGWRQFEATFNFPPMAQMEVPIGRGRSRITRFSTEIFKGDYWIFARYVKSKQPRPVREKINEMQNKIPDYTCGSCSRKYHLPTEARCPQCNDKLTTPVKRHFKTIKKKDGTVKRVPDIRTVFFCRRCNKEIPLPKMDKCRACGSDNMNPTKKDRAIYLESQAVGYVPNPTYDPANDREKENFARTKNRVMDTIQKHYAKIIKKALVINGDLDRNFAAAYKSNFYKNGKLDKEAWKQWLFSGLFKRFKDTSKGRKLVEDLYRNNKFCSTTGEFRRHRWEDYLKTKLTPQIRELVLEHKKYKKAHLAIPFEKAHTYLKRLLGTIHMKGYKDFLFRLFEANKIKYNPADVQPGNLGDTIVVNKAPTNSYLNLLYKRIDREVKVSQKM